MYLLEPKTCQYILVVESPTICDLMHYADSHGLVKPENLNKVHVSGNESPATPAPTLPTKGRTASLEEEIRS